MTDRYEIRKSGKVVASSDLVNLGYSSETLKSMASCGYYLYKNGKKVKT